MIALEAPKPLATLKNYVEFVRKYLDPFPAAQMWVMAYGVYVHAIDDIIDGDKFDSEFILKTFETAAMIYSHEFYRQHWGQLYPLVKMASNTYMDSVLMERSNEKWKKNYADVLRQNGNEVLLAVIEICTGIDRRREASMEIRKLSYDTHHDKQGNPV